MFGNQVYYLAWSILEIKPKAVNAAERNQFSSRRPSQSPQGAQTSTKLTSVSPAMPSPKQS